MSLSIHEASHAWVAFRLGDPTARLLGRMSLNPAVHIDPIGTILFPIVSLVTSVPIIGWAKPVPVNVRALSRHWRQKYMLIAAAGPLSNVALAAIGASVIKLVSVLGSERVSGVWSADGPGTEFLFRAVTLNVFLAAFNMIPVPPLDGGIVLAGLIGGRLARLIDRARPFGWLILYALLWTGTLSALSRSIETKLTTWLL